MKVVPVQQHFDMSYCQSHASGSGAARSRVVTVLSAGFAAVSLLMATPVFGQTTATPVISSDKQNFTCVMKEQSLVCDVQRPGEAPETITFEQKANSEKASETREILVIPTALLTPELDKLLSNILIWTAFLGLPLTMVVAIWSHEQRAREQMVKLAQHITTLERIWQHPPTR